MRIEAVTPAQQRLVDELLGWSAPRPAADPDLPERLRAALEAGIEPALDGIPDGEQLWVSKSWLDRLACDGWFLDGLDEPFEWSTAAARGTLAHRAIELDWRSERRFAPDDLVGRAWEALASDGGTLADFCNGLDGLTRAQLQHDAEQLLTEFRDTWPLLPSRTHARLEQRIRVRLGDGKVVLSGAPDLTIGGIRDQACRVLLVDLKTGRRKPVVERQELRFYALLRTLKYGQAPFRWAAYYVAEGAWDAEDLDETLLDLAVKRVVDGVHQAVRLRWHRPDDAALRLRGGAYCRWCTRAATCPAAEGLDDA